METRTGSLSSVDPTAPDYLVVIRTPDALVDQVSWRTILVAAGYAYLVVLAILSVAVSRGLGPVRVLLLGLVVISLALLRRPGWSGVAFMVVTASGVTADAIYLGGMTGVFHPTSAAQHVSSVGAIATFALVVAAALASVQAPDAGTRPDRTAAVAGASAGVAWLTAVALAAVGGVAYRDPAPVARDVRVRAFRNECTPRVLEAAPGHVSVYVRNQDGARRVFEIAQLGVVLGVPAHRAARTEFTAGPGTYTFVCEVIGRGRRTTGQLVVG